MESSLPTKLARAINLVRAVQYRKAHPGGAVAVLDMGDGGLPLECGTELKFRVIDATRRCLGYAQISLEAKVQINPCPENAAAERGDQCLKCFFKDEFWPIHDAHRGGDVSEALKGYLNREHWLYIATFAHGTGAYGASKVGTASELSRWTRLAEQGAVVAQYVAHAQDGRVVRVLEDAVSTALNLPQQIRKSAKFAGLTQPWRLEQVTEANAQAAAAARAVLADVGIPGFSVVAENWDPPNLTQTLWGRAVAPYPLDLREGEHGLETTGLLGQIALVRVQGSEFLADLGKIKGAIIELGEFESVLPAHQESLF